MKVGILGGGQLARMLALAGYPLGMRFAFIDPSPDAPARDVGEAIVAAYDDERALQRLSEISDIVTFEFENVPSRAVEGLERRGATYPRSRSLATAQDRLAEKAAFEAAGIPVVPYAGAATAAEVAAAVKRVGLPAVAKTVRSGYDGKGQMVLRSNEDATRVWEALGGHPLIVEALADFERELSVIGVRDPDGEMAFYPVSENVHREGILRVSRPRHDVGVQALAETYAESLLRQLDHVGVLALELFDMGGSLLANEMAPRVHNSGHWTIEGAETSQFENHLRAIAGLPLGSTATRGFSAMVNLIGTMPDRDAVLAIPGARLHDYAKAPRPGRKLGHVTVLADDEENLQSRLARVQDLVSAQLTR